MASWVELLVSSSTACSLSLGSSHTLQVPRGSAEPSTQCLSWARFSTLLMKSMLQRDHLVAEDRFGATAVVPAF